MQLPALQVPRVASSPGADDLLLQKTIQGMSVIGGVSDHDKESTLQGKHGKEDSHDLVGDKARSDIEFQVCLTDHNYLGFVSFG